MNKRQEKRLLNVAKALREGRPENFYMGTWGEPVDDKNAKCGTPACALGHYASRLDLQKKVILGRTTGAVHSRASGKRISPFAFAMKHFGITKEEADELFEVDGCGLARTNKQAAKYIENFVKLKKKEQNT